MPTATPTSTRPQPLLGLLLRMMLDTHGVSLRDLAVPVGKSHSHLSRVLSGERALTPELEERLVHVIAALPAKETVA